MRKLNMQQADILHFVQSKQKLELSTYLTRQTQVQKEVGFQVWENEDRTVPKPAYKAFLEHRDVLLRKRGLTGIEPLASQSLT
jgi:dual specificity phosphatase 12